MLGTTRRHFPTVIGHREIRDDHEFVCLAVEVPDDMLYFQGHFPGYPILPGVAQLVPLVLAETRRIWADLERPTRLSRLKFRQPVFPGTTLELQLERRGARIRFRLVRGQERRACSEGTIDYRQNPA